MADKTKQKALIVEDSPTDMGNAARLLMKNGYEIIKAKDGQEALEFMNSARNTGVDLMLVDLMMPNMNGFDFIAYLKANKEWAKIPVIVITGNSKQEHVLRLIPFKISGFIVKPVTNEKLTYQLGQIIQNAKRPEIFFPKGSLLFDVGDSSDKLYHIISGYVGVYKKSVTNNVPLGVVSPYEFLGEMSLITQSLHVCQSVALTSVRANIYEKREFEILLESSSMPVAALISDLIRRLARTNEILASNGLHDKTLEKRIKEIRDKDSF